MEFYAGIGPRATPPRVCAWMTNLAKALVINGYRLRSGGASGADSAFADGDPDALILRPRDATKAAIVKAADYHPAWGACNDYVRKLMGRNTQIILGFDLDDYSKFVVTYTDNEYRGGTAHGLRVARDHDIPVWNLFNGKGMEWMADQLTRAGMEKLIP